MHTTIGIIGNGVVGSTLATWFNEDKTRQYIVRTFDQLPERSSHALDDVLKVDWLFITANFKDNCTTKDSFMHLANLVAMADTPNPVVIKSTVIPGTTEKLALHTGRPVFYCPEFLTEAEPAKTFSRPALQIVGAPYQYQSQAIELLSMLPRGQSERIMTPRAAETLKHVIAIYLATKVTWFNQLYDCLEPHIYNEVVEMLRSEPRIGKTHMDVMQDDYRGWGGKCFTKDVPLFVEQLKAFPLMQGVLRDNEERRKEYFCSACFEQKPGPVVVIMENGSNLCVECWRAREELRSNSIGSHGLLVPERKR